MLPEDVVLGSLYLREGNNKFAVIGYSGNDDDIQIPGVHDGKEVTWLRSKIFFSSALRRVRIPSAIINIGDQCFALCMQLVEVTFEEGSRCRWIGTRAFAGSGITTITIPESVEEIGSECFDSCVYLRELRFMEGSSLTSLDLCLFLRNNVDKIVVPRNVNKVQFSIWACVHSSSTLSLSFEAGSKIRFLERGIFSDKMVTGGRRYTEAEEGITADLISKIVIPKFVERIGDECFYKCKHLTEILFEEGSRLKYIGRRACSETSLSKINIPRSVEVIESEGFRSCSSLCEVLFENNSNLKEIGDLAFSGTKISTIAIPWSIEKLGAGFLDACEDLCGVSFEYIDNVKNIATMKALWQSSSHLEIPRNMTKIPDGCCANFTFLKKITFQEGVQLREFGSTAFRNTSIKSIVIPQSVLILSKECFANCRELTEVTFEEGSWLARIEDGAFTNTNIKRIVIPPNVECIGARCFKGCTDLAEILFDKKSRLKELGEFAFAWTQINNIIIPEGVAIIPNSCFMSCLVLSEIVFEKGTSVKELGELAFCKCDLVKMIIPKSVVTIKRECFSKCENLIELSIEEGSALKTIEPDAFRFTNITSFYIPIRSNLEEMIKDQELDGDAANIIEYAVAKRKTDYKPEDFCMDLEDYKVGRKFAVGPFGALKIVKSDSARFIAKYIQCDASTKYDAFQREFAKLVAISHPCIAKFHGCCIPNEDNDYNLIILTEYIKGMSLQDVLANPPVWFDNTAKAIILAGIALGMREVHDSGVIHSNLCPTNVLLDNFHYPRISDFGSAGYLSHVTAITNRASSHANFYSAPETFDNSFDRKIDIYSFGVIAYELITGKLAFRDKNLPQLVRFICMGNREPIPETVSKFSKDLIERCWAEAPRERPEFQYIYSLICDHVTDLLPGIDIGKFRNFIQLAERKWDIVRVTPHSLVSSMCNVM